jgi:uncharacterized protein (DUF302 family)
MNTQTTTTYSFGTSMTVPFEEVIGLVRDALKAEGFGVLTEIDVQRTLREKLDVEMAPYLILGACNPPLAHRALTADPDIGLLLPCNVVVRAEGSGSRVDIADPQAMLGIAHRPDVAPVAAEARERLLRVIDALKTRNEEAGPDVL